MRKTKGAGKKRQNGLSVYIRPVARRAAIILQQVAERLSGRTKRFGLILFCLVGIGFSTAIIAYSTTGSSAFLPLHRTSFPVFIPPPQHSERITDSLITAAQYWRIRRVKDFLAKQKGLRSGQSFYDSLLRGRPHLLDSLRIIDSLYISQ